MLICAVESSAKAVSVALMENGMLIGESFVNTKQTHSETLMPMLSGLMELTNKTTRDVELFAVSAGPGSFTGIRIGVSCIKGLAFPYNTPCCGVSTLEAIAYSAAEYEGRTVVAVMDARRSQVYNANFRIENGVPIRLTEDRAISIEDLYREGAENPVLAGDGAALCFESFGQASATLAINPLQRAAGVARAAEKLAELGQKVLPRELMPIYLRPSQAERERKEKEEKQ